MTRIPERIPDSLVRLLIVVLALAAAGAFGFFVLIPQPMKDVRLQWEADVRREKSLPVRYAGFSVCQECHEEISARKGAGYHRDLSCETCHGPAKAHSEDPETHRPVVPGGRDFCPRCHGYDPSRPRGFPMINPAAHHPTEACASCHNPHDPKPPVPPAECSACHREIVRTLAVSPHTRLECANCHDVPPEHKVTPRAVRPTKPQMREFCGQCHSKAGANPLAKAAPKVDLVSHGAKYVCWQCHYPHSPEMEL